MRPQTRLALLDDPLHHSQRKTRSNLGAISFNVVGVEPSKDRMLSKEKIHYAFSVFHTPINSFGRDNYLACCLFLVLGVRKSELCEAMWREIDLTTGVWDLPKERSKTGVPISIPLPRQAIAWFVEGIYDRHDYFEERPIAHQTVADVIEPLVNFEPASQYKIGGH